jgi:hypothetical protein
MSRDKEYALDVKRYRWLRTKALWDSHKFPIPPEFSFPEAALFDQGMMMDAAIDAAMRKEK